MTAPTILVVEDDAIIARHLQFVLRKLGYTVDTIISSGEEAVQKVPELLPDLILMDIHLAGEMDGIQAVEEILKIQKIPIIYLTAYAGDDLLKRARVTAPSGYILKPFEDRHLHATIEMALEKHQLENQLQEKTDRYTAVMSQISDGFLLIDPLTRQITEVNPAFLRLVGRNEEDILGKRVERVLGLNTNQFWATVKVENHNSTSWHREYRYQHRDGRYLYLDVSISRIEIQNQTFLCAVVRDITESRVTSENLQKMQDDLEELVHQRTAQLEEINQRLIEAQQQQKALLDGIPDMAWIKDHESRFIAVNQPLARAAGRSAEIMVGASDLDFFPKDLAERYRADDQSVMQSGEMKRVEEPFIDHTGEEHWLETIKIPFFNKAGQVIGTAGIARDVTPRHKAEEDLRQSHTRLEEMVKERTRELEEINQRLLIENLERQLAEEKFRNIVENASVGIFQATIEGRFISANPALAHIFGYDTPQELMSSVRDIAAQLYYDPDQREENLYKAMQTSGFVEIETTYRRKDGARILGLLHYRVVRNSIGEADYLEGFVYDITDRKAAEHLIRQSEERYRAIYNQTPVMLHSVDSQNRLISVSNYWLESTGFTRDEVIGRPFSDFLTYDSRRYALEVVEPAFQKNGVLKEVPYQFVKKNGETIDILLSAVSETDENGKIIRSMAVSLDISRLKRTEEQLQHQLQRLASLRTIQLSISANSDLPFTLQTLLEQLVNQLSIDAAAILLVDPSTQNLNYSAMRGFRTPNLKLEQLRKGQGYAGKVVQERRMISSTNLSDPEESKQYLPLLQNEHFVSFYGVPLIVQGSIKGVLEVFQRSMLIPSADWLEYLNAFAAQAAIIIENTTLFDAQQASNRKLIEAYDATILGWSRTLEMRDQETEGHAQRVAQLSLDLARMLGITDMDPIYRGALLHDIGKVGIPDSILLKPAALTLEEWEIMRRHPFYAYELLAPIEFLRSSLDIPYCHHERWDGSGYPRGLKGEQIPLSARIFAVIDVWDSLTQKRPYRPAWSVEKARAYLQENAGVLFDPRVVDAFFRLGI